MANNLKLITEFFDSVNISKNKDGDTYIEGIFASAEMKNKNERIYKKQTLEREIGKLQESISKKCLWGELNHPTNPDINLERAAILIEKLDWQGNNIVGRAKVLDTPMGKIAKTLIKEGMVGISSRGLGSVNEDGYVNDGSFNLLTFDLVSNPSNHPSWVKGVYEGHTFTVNGVEEPKELSEQEAKKAYKNYILETLKKLV